MKKQALYSSTGKLSTASFRHVGTACPNARRYRKFNYGRTGTICDPHFVGWAFEAGGLK
jgi:hypothetical protein